MSVPETWSQNRPTPLIANPSSLVRPVGRTLPNTAKYFQVIANLALEMEHKFPFCTSNQQSACWANFRLSHNGTMATLHEELDRVFFESGIVRVGAFRCHPEQPCFHDTGPIRHCCFVFPRTAVEIQHEHEPAFVTNANVVTFYNVGQVYWRNPISPKGDNCDWFGVDPELVRHAVREFDPCVDNRPERPFQLSHGWSDAATYLLQRRLFTWVTGSKPVDPLAVEESVIELLDRVVRSAYSARVPYTRPHITLSHRDTVHDVETILSRPAEERLTLKSIAREVGLSAFHVCRLFRRVTGMRLQQYRLRLRLREALAEVVGSRRSLTDIALDAGFSSHSHFTDIFHHEFQTTPSSLRTAFPGNFLIGHSAPPGIAISA